MSLFERGNVKLSALVDHSGKVKETFAREDLSAPETEHLLGAVHTLKNTWTGLIESTGKEALHLQSTHFAASIYLSAAGYFMFLFDVNPVVQEICDIQQTQVEVQALIGALVKL